ncbi:DUF3460 family protein [Glaciimonas sp. GG7]
MKSKQFTNYQSETTLFINELKVKNPDLEKQQLAGRALLWDKTPIDLDSQLRTADSRVAQQPYVYQNEH